MGKVLRRTQSKVKELEMKAEQLKKVETRLCELEELTDRIYEGHRLF